VKESQRVARPSRRASRLPLERRDHRGLLGAGASGVRLRCLGGRQSTREQQRVGRTAEPRGLAARLRHAERQHVGLAAPPDRLAVSRLNLAQQSALQGLEHDPDRATDVYAGGASESTLGQSFKNLGVARTDVVLATKVYSRMGQGRNNVGASRGHIMEAVEASLKRLQTDHIDLYQIHATDTVTPVEETLRAPDDLIRQGKVRYVGVSNWQAWRVATALGISARLNLARFETLQAYYSIAGRDLERELSPLLEAEKVGLLVWSPLAGGLLSGKFSRDNQSPEGSRRTSFDFPIVDKDRAWNVIDVVRPIAEAHGCSPARIALAWLLSKPVVTSVIVGAKRLG
jgi:aryl-alcohol dehydrogenase-like predicted oxidoreductase